MKILDVVSLSKPMLDLHTQLWVKIFLCDFEYDNFLKQENLKSGKK